MQEKNVLALEYLDDGDRIADFINVVYFEGAEVVHSEEVQEMDSTAHKIRKVWGKANTWIYARDFLRKVVLGTEYLMIGIEHQTDINLTMPVRVMGYDADVYEKQIRRLKKHHRKQRDIKSYEFTSGIAKEDKLIPVLTTVLYFGEEPWSAPRDLHGMLKFDERFPGVKEYIPNYPIRVIEVRRYPQWKRFKTDLRLVFGYLQHIQDGNTIFNYLQENKEEYEHISEDTYDLLGMVTSTKELAKIKDENRNREGGIDMCKAIQELIDKGKDDGEQRMAQLMGILLEKSQTKELSKAVKNKKYRNKLFEKYHL